MDYKVGTWSPSDAVLPQIDVDCNFAQFYIRESGSIEGLDLNFKAGNWLLFIREYGKENWYQTSGSVIVNTSQNNLFPKAGFYTKIQLDNSGNIIGTADLDEFDLPEHSHDADSISKFDEKAVKSVFNGLQADPACPLEFRYNEKNSSITFYLKVDETSIGINKYGQLESRLAGSSEGGSKPCGGECGNHKHDISSIEGLEEFVDSKFQDINAKPSSDWLDEQTIILNEDGRLTVISSSTVEHNHTLEEIVDFPHQYLEYASNQVFKEIEFTNGKLDLSDSTIGGAIKVINENLLETDIRLNELEKVAGKVVPKEPYNIDKTRLIYKENNTIKVMKVDDLQETFASTGFSVESEMIYPKSGKLSLYLNGTEHFIWNVNEISPSNGMTFTYKGDFYENDENYQNFFEGFKFKFTINDLPENSYNAYFIHSFDGKEIMSESFNFNVYKQPENPYYLKGDVIDVESNDIISGIPCYTSKQNFIVYPYVDNFTSGKYFPINFIKVDGIPLSIDSIENNKIKYNRIVSSLIPPENQVSISIDIFDFFGNKIETKKFDSSKVFYNSSIIEKEYRVGINDFSQTRIPYLNEDLSFTKWDSSLKLFNQQFECYILNDIAYTKPKNFSEFGGPNYNSDFGETIDGRLFKWIELKIHCDNKVKSLKMRFQDEKGNPFEIEKDGQMKEVKVYIGLTTVGDVPLNYIDGQKYFKPWTSLTGKDFNGLDLYRSNEYEKVYSLGSSDYDTSNKDIYLMIAIERSLDLKTLIESLLESLSLNRY